MIRGSDSARGTTRKTKCRGLKGLYMNYSKRPFGMAATSPRLFETKQEPDPAHQHASTHTHTHTHTQAVFLTNTHMHKDTLAKNGVTGFHGAVRLTDRAGVLTCSQTTERMMEGKKKRTEGESEGERGRGWESTVKTKQNKEKCRIGEIYHTQAAGRPWG